MMLLSTVMGKRGEHISPPGTEGCWEFLGEGKDEELSLSFRHIVDIPVADPRGDIQ